MIGYEWMNKFRNEDMTEVIEVIDLSESIIYDVMRLR